MASSDEIRAVGAAEKREGKFDGDRKSTSDDSDAEKQIDAASHTSLKRKLKSRHLQMIAIGT